MSALLWFGSALSVIVVVAMALWSFGARRWAARIRELNHQLETNRSERSSAGITPARFDGRVLDTLPAPVQRYFRAVLKEGQPMVSALTIHMTGTMAMASRVATWWPFTSLQRVHTRRPGFVWNARVALLPGIQVRVVDSYIAGEGRLCASVLGLYAVAEVEGGTELAHGELLRFLAEAPWYPTALLPSQGVQWSALDGCSATATLVDGSVTASLIFRFNAQGLIDSVRAQARGAMVGGTVVMLPWECLFSGYALHDGMTLPTAGEAAWMPPEGRQPYFRGSVTALAFDYAG